MEQNSTFPLLSKVNSPADLRKFSVRDLVSLSDEIRKFIIDVVSSNPGHFGASLGVVELTVALHYIYNVPHDKIIWDVGHQAYAHKILTGRRDIFHTNRKLGGISGFPKILESKYDSFGTGHASTSISAALGIDKAFYHLGEPDRHVVAVIGDGALTGGLAYEGLNNAGIEKTNLLVILNDNNIAIDPNVGAMKDYLLDITTSKTYNRVKRDIWNLLGYFNRLAPEARASVQIIENAIKSLLLRHSNLFETLNFRYFGPVDGHDVTYLVKVLQDLKNIPGPKLLHCITVKGKGFKQAEMNQTIYHSPGKFNKYTGEILSDKSDTPLPSRFQDVFGETLLELAEVNPAIIGITPAMPTGCSLKIMMDKFPDRTYDVGIAEQHAVTFAAGLASQGVLPFCNIYSSFIQRSYDQIIHDVALQNLNVIFCLDRAGLVGDDGPTHHGIFDIAFMRSIPNMIVSAPMDESELRNLMYTAQLKDHGPFSIRYPRGRGVITNWKQDFVELPVGKGRQLSYGKDIAILSIGYAGILVTEAISMLKSDGIKVAHFDMRFVKPIDEELLHEVFKTYDLVITVEDGILQGGFGSAVLEFINENHYQVKIRRLGIPDEFIEHGTRKELFRLCGFDPMSIASLARDMVGGKILQKLNISAHKK